MLLDYSMGQKQMIDKIHIHFLTQMGFCRSSHFNNLSFFCVSVIFGTAGGIRVCDTFLVQMQFSRKYCCVCG